MTVIDVNSFIYIEREKNSTSAVVQSHSEVWTWNDPSAVFTYKNGAQRERKCLFYNGYYPHVETTVVVHGW